MSLDMSRCPDVLSGFYELAEINKKGIEHNDHKNYFDTIKNYFRKEFTCFSEKDISIEEYEKCKELDELWAIRWYPYQTTSFKIVFASTLEKCLELVEEMEKDCVK